MHADCRLRECRELEYILFGDLRDLLEEVDSPETVRWMKVVLDALLETIPEEFALKSEPQGYLNDVLQEFPNWESDVIRLEDEYYALYRRLFELRRRIDSQQNYRLIARRLSQDILDWMEAFRTYIQSEQQIVMLAANLEVGGED